MEARLAVSRSGTHSHFLRTRCCETLFLGLRKTLLALHHDCQLNPYLTTGNLRLGFTLGVFQTPVLIRKVSPDSKSPFICCVSRHHVFELRAYGLSNSMAENRFHVHVN